MSDAINLTVKICLTRTDVGAYDVNVSCGGKEEAWKIIPDKRVPLYDDLARAISLCLSELSLDALGRLDNIKAFQ